MKPSLKDISKALGLSTAAVSKALNDYPDIGKATKKRVKSYAKKMGYQPNAQATFLRTQKTKMVGVIIPNATNPFFASILEGIMNQAQKKNYSVLVGHSKESQTLEKALVGRFLQQKVDGIFLSLAQDTSNYDHLEEVINSKTNLILFDKVAKVINCSKVFVDDKNGAFQATTHLISKGCTKIAHFRGELNPQNSIDRYLGYRKALANHKISYDPKKVLISRKGSIDEGYQLAKKLHQSGIEIDGLFCVTDMLALGAIRFYKEQKVEVPNAISVIGFSNTMVGELTYPSLSTIDQKAIQMGKKVMKLFLSEQRHEKDEKNPEYQSIMLKTKLLQRESTARSIIN